MPNASDNGSGEQVDGIANSPAGIAAVTTDGFKMRPFCPLSQQWTYTLEPGSHYCQRVPKGLCIQLPVCCLCTHCTVTHIQGYKENLAIHQAESPSPITCYTCIHSF